MRIVETTRPCTVEERGPNVVANCGIVVKGPIVPVSSLGRVRAYADIDGEGETYPNSAPPKEISVACWMYFGGWSHDLCILKI